MRSGRGDGQLRPPGFPIRTSSDHSLVADSPRLIAGSNVLHRLLVPRHPPCALKNLAVNSADALQDTARKGGANLQEEDARVHCAVLKIRTALGPPPRPQREGLALVEVPRRPNNHDASWHRGSSARGPVSSGPNSVLDQDSYRPRRSVSSQAGTY